MFKEKYPRLFEMFREAAEMVTTAEALVTANHLPADFTKYFAATDWYVRLTMSLAVNLLSHPEWADALEDQIPSGCMAFKAPIVGQFLQDNGGELV